MGWGGLVHQRPSVWALGGQQARAQILGRWTGWAVVCVRAGHRPQWQLLRLALHSAGQLGLCGRGPGSVLCVKRSVWGARGRLCSGQLGSVSGGCVEASVAGVAVRLQARCRGGFPTRSARGPRLPLPVPRRQLAQGRPPVGDFLPMRVTGTSPEPQAPAGGTRATFGRTCCLEGDRDPAGRGVRVLRRLQEPAVVQKQLWP